MDSTRSMAIRHNALGYAIMADLHTEKMDKITFDDASGTERFWLPNDDVDEGGDLCLTISVESHRARNWEKASRNPTSKISIYAPKPTIACPDTPFASTRGKSITGPLVSLVNRVSVFSRRFRILNMRTFMAEIFQPVFSRA